MGKVYDLDDYRPVRETCPEYNGLELDAHDMFEAWQRLYEAFGGLDEDSLIRE